MTNDNITTISHPPSPEFVRRDEYGRTMYFFCATYTYEKAQWSVEFWAYSMADAKQRLSAMKADIGDSGVFQILEKIDG